MGVLVDTMIHVSDPLAKPSLQARLVAMPGVVPARLRTDKPHLLFVSYDPAVFDIRNVGAAAAAVGTRAQVVGI